MKKLLVVMLVLAMASMANAAMYLTINATDNPTDTIEALTGDVLTIDIYGDGVTTQGYFFIDAGGVGQTDTWDISQASMDYLGSATDLTINDDLELFTPFIYFLMNDVPTGTNTKLPLGPDPNPLLDTILLTVGLGLVDEVQATEATSIITLYDQDLNVLGTYTVHVTPEPITVALLGLGGLMLRRRK